MIYVIGVGLGGRGSLSAGALRAIDRSVALAGGRRHLGLFPEFPGEKIEVSGGLEGVASRICRHVEKGRCVAVLATGDPLLFGIGDSIIRRFGKRSVKVIPNVSVVQEAFSRIKENWNGATVVSAHGRGISSVIGEIARHNKAAVFTDPENTPAKLSLEMRERGLRGYTAYVFESLGAPDEKVTRFTLEGLSRRKRFSPLSTVLFIKDKDVASSPEVPAHKGSRIPDNSFSRSGGMITKEEIRVLALSKLTLRPDSVVWDIGAGSGSVSVGAALSAPSGRVYAVEKDRRRVRDIRENKRRFGCVNLDIIEGEAPGCLKGLQPRPDAVFVGGGGAGLKDILGLVAKRIRPGGTVVVNAVTIESAYGAFNFFKDRRWERELTVINISKAKDLGGLSMLSAQNPVFMIAARSPEK